MVDSGTQFLSLALWNCQMFSFLKFFQVLSLSVVLFVLSLTFSDTFKELTNTCMRYFILLILTSNLLLPINPLSHSMLFLWTRAGEWGGQAGWKKKQKILATVSLLPLRSVYLYSSVSLSILLRNHGLKWWFSIKLQSLEQFAVLGYSFFCSRFF